MSKRIYMIRACAVSAAAMLMIGSMVGCASSDAGKTPAETGPGSSLSTALEQENAALKRENAELRAQLEQQKQQVRDLQDTLLTLTGSEEFMPTTDPGDEDTDARMQAIETFTAIQAAYADFDREKLEELIPQMDAQIAHLPQELLNTYYQILEYVEQPSNG